MKDQYYLIVISSFDLTFIKGLKKGSTGAQCTYEIKDKAKRFLFFFWHSHLILVAMTILLTTLSRREFGYVQLQNWPWVKTFTHLPPREVSQKGGVKSLRSINFIASFSRRKE